MPLRKPGKNEDQADWMKYCMHELTQSDQSKPAADRRDNDQKVAICMQAWRDRNKEDDEPRKDFVKVLERVGEFLTKEGAK